MVKYTIITVIYKSLGPSDSTDPHLGQLSGILLGYDFALFFALAPISPMFCPKRLPLPCILPFYFWTKERARANIEGKHGGNEDRGQDKRNNRARASVWGKT